MNFRATTYISERQNRDNKVVEEVVEVKVGGTSGATFFNKLALLATEISKRTEHKIILEKTGSFRTVQRFSTSVIKNSGTIRELQDFNNLVNSLWPKDKTESQYWMFVIFGPSEATALKQIWFCSKHPSMVQALSCKGKAKG